MGLHACLYAYWLSTYTGSDWMMGMAFVEIKWHHFQLPPFIWEVGLCQCVSVCSFMHSVFSEQDSSYFSQEVVIWCGCLPGTSDTSILSQIDDIDHVSRSLSYCPTTFYLRFNPSPWSTDPLWVSVSQNFVPVESSWCETPPLWICNFRRCAHTYTIPKWVSNISVNTVPVLPCGLLTSCFLVGFAGCINNVYWGVECF